MITTTVELAKHPSSPTDGRRPFWVWRLTDEGAAALAASKDGGR